MIHEEVFKSLYSLVRFQWLSNWIFVSQVKAGQGLMWKRWDENWTKILCFHLWKSKKEPISKKYLPETGTFFFSCLFSQKGRFTKVLLFIHSGLFIVLWCSEDSLQKSVLCFCRQASGNQTLVVQPDLATFTNEKPCPAQKSSFPYLFYSVLHF